MVVASYCIEDVLNQAMAARSNLASSSLTQPSPSQQAARELTCSRHVTIYCQYACGGLNAHTHIDET